ncbi:MAG: hypothetical protein PHQ86_08870 [Dehalococcoidales bacterium]|nr:hypothetical protein [Dehalococcoidales bacterium]
MEKEKFCDALSGKTCTVVHEDCFRINERKPCEYNKTYLPKFTDIRADTPPIARKASEAILKPFLANWKEHAHNHKAGLKRVVASPVENVLRDILKAELAPLNVRVSDKGEVFNIWGNNKIIADATAKKEGFPTSIFSFKTWIGNEQIRETFAYAYLAKTWLGQKNLRIYEIGVIHTDTETKTIESLIKVCEPYLDGVFYLTAEPYLDELIEKLKETYSKRE